MTHTLEELYVKLSRELPLALDEEAVEKRMGSSIERTLAEYFVQLGSTIPQNSGSLELASGTLSWQVEFDDYDEDYGEINFFYEDITFRLYFWVPYGAKARTYTQVMLTEEHFFFSFDLTVELHEVSASFMAALAQVQEVQHIRGSSRGAVTVGSPKELLNVITDNYGVYEEHYEFYLTTGETIIVHGRLGRSVEDQPIYMVMSYGEELYALTGSYNSYGSHHWNFEEIWRCSLSYKGTPMAEFERLGEEYLDLD